MGEALPDDATFVTCAALCPSPAVAAAAAAAAAASASSCACFSASRSSSRFQRSMMVMKPHVKKLPKANVALK